MTLEERGHDLEMTKRNMEQLREMLEETSQSSESIQQERLQSMAGEAANFILTVEKCNRIAFFQNQPSKSSRLRSVA